MTKTHWKKFDNPDYLGAYAFQPGQEMILTIREVRQDTVTGPDGKSKERVAHFQEQGVKPMILNTTNSKTIEKVYGTPYIEDWPGKKVQLFVTQVKAFGEVVDAVRVRPFKPKEELLLCDECKEPVKDHGEYSAAVIAKNAQTKFGKSLCYECAVKERAKVGVTDEANA